VSFFGVLTTDENLAFLMLFRHKLSCIWPQGNEAS